MSRDLVLWIALVVVPAAWLTVHVALCFGVARRSWWRGLVAMLVLPLAPWWGLRARLWLRSGSWLALVVAYAIVRWAART